MEAKLNNQEKSQGPLFILVPNGMDLRGKV
jgi:hypothetical protein